MLLSRVGRQAFGGLGRQLSAALHLQGPSTAGVADSLQGSCSSSRGMASSADGGEDFAASRRAWKKELNDLRKRYQGEVADDIRAEQKRKADERRALLAAKEARLKAKKETTLANAQKIRVANQLRQEESMKRVEGSVAQFQERQVALKEREARKVAILAERSKGWVAEEEFEQRIMDALASPKQL